MAVLEQTKDDTRGRDRRVSRAPASKHIIAEHSPLFQILNHATESMVVDLVPCTPTGFRYMAPEMVDKKEEKTGYDRVSAK